MNHKADRSRKKQLFILSPVRQLAGTPFSNKPETVLNIKQTKHFSYSIGRRKASAELSPKRRTSFLREAGFIFFCFMAEKVSYPGKV